MRAHVVGRAADVPEGGGLIVSVAGREIGIFNVEGRFRAYLNRCADQGGPVCQGGRFDDIVAHVTPEGRIAETVASRGAVLACPWHGWEYDLRTGTCLWNPRYHLREYRLEVDADGRLVLHL